MDLSVDEFLEGLFSKEAFEQPSDTKRPEDIEMTLPEWFDEKQFNKARRFYWNNCFQFTSSMLLGLVAVLSIPSILRVLIGTRRSNSTFTAYRRYLSTLLHTVSWFENELKPGSISWRSLLAVRNRHVRASLAANLKGQGIVSQRDLALTQFGFIGFSLLNADSFGIRQLEDGDWEAYNHFWAVIGHAIGLEDRYNICRARARDTRRVCAALRARVFRRSLGACPEYFEHAARVMLGGMWTVNPTVHEDAMIYWTKRLCGVPGYAYTEAERIDLQTKIAEQLKGNSDDIGVEITSLLEGKPLLELPKAPPQLLFLRDYECLESSPAYRRLPLAARYKLAMNVIIAALANSYVGRIFLNLNFRFSLLLMKYFPYMAFFKFGVLASYVKIFKEDPTDDEEPKPNAEYYKEQPPQPLYKELLSMVW